tara:strand:- start:90396 stop:91085 length:690 start_codon:yes stop_codon:yes gene_type:complete
MTDYPIVGGYEPPINVNGPYIDSVDLLMDCGITPMSMDQILTGQLEAISSGDPNQRAYWLRRDFDSSDCVIFIDDLAIFGDVADWFDLIEEFRSDSGLDLREAKHEFVGNPFYRADLQESFLGHQLLPTELKNHPVIKSLYGKDTQRLFDYLNEMYDMGISEPTIAINLDLNAINPRDPCPVYAFRSHSLLTGNGDIDVITMEDNALVLGNTDDPRFPQDEKTELTRTS